MLWIALGVYYSIWHLFHVLPLTVSLSRASSICADPNQAAVQTWGLESALILALERRKALSRSDSACRGRLNRQSATNWMRFMLSYSSVSGSIHDLQEKVLIIRKSIGSPTDRLNLSVCSQVKSCVTLYSGGRHNTKIITEAMRQNTILLWYPHALMV